MKLRCDLHSHSNYSRDSLISPEAYIAGCVRKGITCAAVTDHNEIAGAFAIRDLAARREAPLKIIVGEEVKTAEGEIIGLFLKELVPRGMSPEDTVRAIHEQGAIVTIPHPYDVFRRSVIRRDALERIVDSVDAVEGFNCRNILARHDERAQAIARRAGKPLTAGTDAHSPVELGGVYVEMNEFDTPAEFLTALDTGTIVGKRSLPLVHWLSTFAKVRWRLGLRPSYAVPPQATSRRAR